MSRIRKDSKGVWRVYGLMQDGREILLGPRSGYFGATCVNSVPVLADDVGFKFDGPEDESAQDVIYLADEWEKEGKAELFEKENA